MWKYIIDCAFWGFVAWLLVAGIVMLIVVIIGAIGDEITYKKIKLAEVDELKEKLIKATSLINEKDEEIAKLKKLLVYTKKNHGGFDEKQ